MTDTIRLNKAIKNSGYMKQYLAEQLGISRSYFLSKVKGDVDFKASEIVKLSELLNLSKTDRDLIFFKK